MSLDDIWDEPIVPPPNPAPENDQTSPLKRPRQSLFLSSSDSDEERPPKRPTPAPPSARPDVDALFEDIDKEDDDDDLRYKPLAPALDLEKLAKEAEARHTSGRPTVAGGVGVDTSGKEGAKGKPSDGEKPGRKVLPKLDEERLVGPEGFPLLIEQVKGFKSKGKGNEHADLNRLLQIYRLWTHKMYPKTSFKDTVSRVEKLCHSKRMQVRLGVWRDEFNGITKGNMSADEPDVIDLTEPTLVVPEDDGGDKDDNSEPSYKPLSPMRTGTASSENGLNMEADDDAGLWNALDDPLTLVDPPQSTPPSSAAGADDEDAWDVVDEIMMEQEEQKGGIKIPISGVNSMPSSERTDNGDAPRATNDDDLDEMYS